MYFHPSKCSAVDFVMLRVGQVLSGCLPRDAWLHRIELGGRYPGLGAEIRLDASQRFCVVFARRNREGGLTDDDARPGSSWTTLEQAMTDLRDQIKQFRECEADDRAEALAAQGADDDELDEDYVDDEEEDYNNA